MQTQSGKSFCIANRKKQRLADMIRPVQPCECFYPRSCLGTKSR